MARRVRDMDWSTTPLGPIEDWPLSLRTAVGILLNSRFPMFVWWGPQLINIYNDAYIPVLGKRHPDALGRSAPDIWGEIWPVVGPQADLVMRRGESTWNERVLLVMERNGYVENTFFTWSYSPIPDETGAIGGLFCACTEDTSLVRAELERDQLLGQLAVERARLTTAFEQSPAFLAVLRGPNHVFEMINDRYAQLIGRRDVITKPVREALPELIDQGFLQLLDRVYQTGEPYVGTNVKVSLRRKRDGGLEERRLDFVYQPLRDADDAVIGILAHGVDVTQRSRAEQAQRESEERYRSFIRLSSEGIWRFEMETPVPIDLSEDEQIELFFKRAYLAECNDAMARMYGFSTASEITGRPLTDFHDRSDPRSIEFLHAFIRNGYRLEDAESNELDKDGNRRVFLNSFVGIVEGETLIRAWGLQRDVTIQRRTEAALRSSEQQMRLLTDSLPALISYVGSDQRYQFNNRAYLDWMGVRPEELRGQHLRDVIGEDAYQQRLPHIDAALRGETVRFDGPTRHRSKGMRDTEVLYVPDRAADGTVAGFVALIQDVTERRQSEARNRFLLSLDDAVRPLTDPAEITATHARMLGEYLNADRCAYADVEADEDTFNLIGNYNRGVPSIIGRYRFTDFGREVLRLMREDKPYVVHDIDAHQPPPESLAAYRQTMIQAVICVPLHKAGRFVAAMAVHQKTPRKWTPEEVSLVRHVANRCWESIERARVERTLRESEAAFRQLADAMPQIVFAATPQGHVDYFNRQWYEYTGLPEGSIGFEAWRHVHTPDGLQRVMERWPEALRTGQPYEVEYPLRRHDGVYRWHLARALPIRDEQRNIVRWFGTNTDIHDRKRIEAALELDKKVLEQIATGIPLADVLHTLVEGIEVQSDDGMLCSIMVLDEAGERLLHGAAPNLPGEYNRTIDGVHIGPDVGSCGTAAYLRRQVCVDDIATDPLWKNYRDVALTSGLASCCSTPIFSSSGAVIGTVAMYYRRARSPGERDAELIASAAHLAGIVIEQTRAEQKVRQALEAEQTARAEAEHASRAKDEFLATLSHELRTPLTPVLLTVSLMESNPALPAELRDDVATIRRNVELESRLISDLLDLTRIAKGKLQLEMQQVDLHLIVRSAIDICQREASAKLTTDLRASRHAVRGDSTRLQQIFWNLINNAQKFTPADGSITVRSMDAPNGLVRVEISDTGVGIDADVLPRLFSAFEQGEIRTVRQQAGLGLGLAISRRLAQIHGGTVTAHSEGRGRGATFVVELPVTEMFGLEIAPQNAGPVTHLSRKLDVLLVEDHEPTLRVMTKLLRQLGHDVTGVTSAASATSAGRQHDFDLIVSDLGLPDGSGLDVMRELRDKYFGRAIALTGYGMETDIAASRDAGFADHLTKPVDVNQLQDAIRRITH